MNIKVNDSKDPVAEQDSLLVQVDYANQPIPNNRLPKGLYYSFKNKWVDMITLLTPAIKKIITANTTVPAWGSITGTLSNQTDLQSALDAKQSNDLTDSHIFVGNATNKATDVAMTGDVTIDNMGVTTLADTAVIANTYGDSTNVPQITVDSKGRITNASNIAISVPTVTPSALTKNDDTNVTLTLGGTPSTALLQAVSLTLGWTGTLADSRIASASTWNSKLNNPLTTKGDILIEDATLTPSRLGIGSPSQILTVDNITGLPAWRNYPILGSLYYFWTPTASDVATYYAETILPYAPLTPFSTAGVTNGQLLRTFITPPNSPNRSFIPAGEYICHIHAAKTSGTKDAYLYAEIWETTSAGVDIAKIATLGTSSILTNASAEYLISYSTLQYTLASTTSRLATKVYATISGGGSAPTIEIYTGGTSDSRTNFPVSAIDIALYVPYTGATSDLTTAYNINLSAETASTIASFDASKNIKSLALATYPSLTELSYVKGVTSSLQTQLGLKANKTETIFVIGNYNTSVTLTGTTNETSLGYVLIPANTLASDDTLQIESLFTRVAGTSTIVVRMRISTSSAPVIASATLLATQNLVNTTKIAPFVRRNIHIDSPTSTILFFPSTAAVEDNTASTNITTLNIDWTVDQYIHISGQLITSGDSITLHKLRLLK